MNWFKAFTSTFTLGFNRRTKPRLTSKPRSPTDPTADKWISVILVSLLLVIVAGGGLAGRSLLRGIDTGRSMVAASVTPAAPEVMATIDEPIVPIEQVTVGSHAVGSHARSVVHRRKVETVVIAPAPDGREAMIRAT